VKLITRFKFKFEIQMKRKKEKGKKEKYKRKKRKMACGLAVHISVHLAVSSPHRATQFPHTRTRRPLDPTLSVSVSRAPRSSLHRCIGPICQSCGTHASAPTSAKVGIARLWPCTVPSLPGVMLQRLGRSSRP
jgi:hypothetical protein